MDKNDKVFKLALEDAQKSYKVQNQFFHHSFDLVQRNIFELILFLMESIYIMKIGFQTSFLYVWICNKIVREEMERANYRGGEEESETLGTVWRDKKIILIDYDFP